MNTKHIWKSGSALCTVLSGLSLAGLASYIPCYAGEQTCSSTAGGDAQQEEKALRMRAEQGDAKAQYTLGNNLLCGKKVTKNEQEGAKWISLAAKQGYRDAITEMGMCYMNGRGVPMNKELGKQWLLRAAIKGDGRAMVFLRSEGYAFMETNGILIYTTPDGKTVSVPQR